MKFLSTVQRPAFTITRRRAVIDEVRNKITMTETIITLTMPSFWQGIKAAARRAGDAILDAFGGLVVPKVYAL